MIKEKINASSVLGTSVISIIIGLVSLFTPTKLLTASHYIFLFIIMVFGSLDFIYGILTKKKHNFLMGVLKLSIGAIFVYSPLSIYKRIPFLIAGYSFIISFFSFVTLYVYTIDKLPGRRIIAFEALSSLFFGILLIVSPYVYSKYVFKIIGLFFVAYGLLRFVDFVLLVTKLKLNHHYRLTYPIIFSALLPSKIVKYVRYVAQSEGSEAEVLQPKSNEKYDLEILIHLGDDGFDSFGHVELAFDDLVISYGCHDHHNTKLMGALGPGVIYLSERKKYVNYTINERNRSVASFGIKLNENEKYQVKATLLEMASRLERWDSDYDLYLKGLPYKGNLQNYASRLARDVNASLFKFKYGKYKTYFLMSNNCVLLADTIVGKSGIDLLKLHGMTSPGCYYEFLNDEYLIEQSKVVARSFYTADTIKKLNDNEELENIIRKVEDPYTFINDMVFKECVIDGQNTRA